MDFQLRDHVVLVSGGAKGIGLGLPKSWQRKGPFPSLSAETPGIMLLRWPLSSKPAAKQRP